MINLMVAQREMIARQSTSTATGQKKYVFCCTLLDRRCMVGRIFKGANASQNNTKALGLVITEKFLFFFHVSPLPGSWPIRTQGHG